MREEGRREEGEWEGTEGLGRPGDGIQGVCTVTGKATRIPPPPGGSRCLPDPSTDWGLGACGWLRVGRGAGWVEKDKDSPQR